MAWEEGNKEFQLCCGYMVQLGLSGDAWIWVPIQEDTEASLLQPVNAAA